MATPQRSFPDVLQDMVSKLEQIIQYEFRLAKTEIREKTEEAARPALKLGVGLVLAFYALGFFLLASVYALSMVIANWMAALIVGAVVGLVAVILLNSSGKKLKKIDFTPEKTIQSL